ncbi:reverse transcriptase [Trichonephila clavipes]|nr:reverse transcriptase [Trichonephila clavipes]
MSDETLSWARALAPMKTHRVCRSSKPSLWHNVKVSPYTVFNSFGKTWKTLTTVGSIPRHLERTKAVARFRLTTGHDFLGVYIHWLDLAADEACSLCSHARMDGVQCTGLLSTRLTTSSIGSKHERCMNK